MLARKRRAATREAENWESKLDEILQGDLWRQVGSLRQIPSNSQILLRKRGYKELVKCELSLRMSLALPWQHGAEFADGLIGDVRPVNQIYEYWCFLSLFEILDDFCEKTAGGNFIIVSKDGLRVQLARGQSSESRFEFSSADGATVKVSLFYNRSFRRPTGSSSDWKGSYTTTFNPDFSIAVSAPGGPSPHWLHFDAKYRLERREVEELFQSSVEAKGSIDASLEYTAELSRVHKQDDLFKMHTYRDGILSSRGAYILFPGDGVGGQTEAAKRNFFVRHPTALAGGSSQRIPSVGAFSLAPAGSAAQRLKIRELLLTTFEAVASGNKYKEEQGYF